jgi:hypothetical protein
MMLRSAIALTILLSGFTVRAEPPAKDKLDEAALLKSLKEADAVFTAKIGEVKLIAQTNSIPPSIRGDVTFKDVKALRGKSEEKKYAYTYKEGTTKNLDLDAEGQVIVAVKAKGVSVIIPATEANLALVKKAEEKK